MAIEHGFIGTQAAARLQPVQQRVIVRTIHPNAGVKHAKDPRAQLKGEEMHAHEHHAIAFRPRLFHVFIAHHGVAFAHPPRWPEPCHPGFDHPHAYRFKITLQQRLAFILIHLRKAKLKVAAGNLDAPREQAHRQPPQAVTDSEQQRIRQQHDEPQRGNAGPAEPVAGVKKGEGKPR